jgi:PhnB protein
LGSGGSPISISESLIRSSACIIRLPSGEAYRPSSSAPNTRFKKSIWAVALATWRYGVRVVNPARIQFAVAVVMDAAYRRAMEAGAISLSTPVDHEYGERGASIRDGEGNHWYLGTAAGPHHIPEGLHAVNIYLHPKGTPAMDFLKRARGAEEIQRHEAGGAVVHAQLKFGDSMLEMGEAHGPYPSMPSAIHYYVPDVDQAYRRAVGAGAVSISAPADQPYGERSAGVSDPNGNIRYLATHTSENR